MDMVNRIVAASGEVGGYSLVLEEDKDHGGYIVKIKDNNATFGGLGESTYTPPKVDRLYDMVLTRVSPFNVLVSFRRTPEISRYQKAHNVRGAALTNYLTRRLKFSIEKAELRFAKYKNRNLKGPLDHLFESFRAVYTSRMKYKIMNLLSSTSLKDWRFLLESEDKTLRCCRGK
jgi:vacuolar protein sorting-associated protein 13A/C